MKTFSVAVIAGDGVGREVTPAAIRVAEQAGKDFQAQFDWEFFDWGSDHYLQMGRMMPENALALLQGKEAILLGAIGDPRQGQDVCERHLH